MHAQPTNLLTPVRAESRATSTTPRPSPSPAPVARDGQAPTGLDPERGRQAAEQVARRIEEASRHLEQVSRRLRFEVDDSSGRMIVAIVDSETSEVIRQIPAEEMLEVARRLDEQLSSQLEPTGLLLTDEV
jgi:flagellar protein FlaG